MDDQEARGPHLPDRVTAVPWPVWIFVLFAIADVAWTLDHTFFGAGPDVASVLNFAIDATWSAAACLLPAALLVRHPDAARRAPLLLFGAILYALVQGLQILAEPLQPIFEQLTPGSGDLPFLAAAEIYRQAGGLIAAIGLACIGLGLTRARRFEDRRSIAVMLFVPVVLLLTVLTVLDSIQQIVLGDIAVTPTYATFLGIAIVIGILRILAWALLTAMATQGSSAGEDPGNGWRLAALGGDIVLVSFAVSTILSLFQVSVDLQGDSLLWVAYAYSGAFALGHVCLLAGFAVGLPALEPLETSDEEADDEEADDES